MNSQRLRAHGCTRKKRYASKADATAALESIVARTGVFHARLNAYACRWCGGWHVGARRPAHEKVNLT